jgi:large subunit ribosomal protein L4
MNKANNTISVYDLDGKVVENIQLDGNIFTGRVNEALLYEAKKMYEANRRSGNACVRTRAEVSGGGAKPWRQKGTGRARVGSSRNPIWRHGGVAHGPRTRDFSYSLPRKALRRALLSGLNARMNEEMIRSVVKVDLDGIKTAGFRKILDNLKIDKKALVVVDRISDNLKLSSRNLRDVRVKEGRNINVMDVLLHEYLVIEKDALTKLFERLI